MNYRRRKRRTNAELAAGPVSCCVCPVRTDAPRRGRCEACYKRALRAEQRGEAITDAAWVRFDRRRGAA